jgi:hypothetical protein
MSSCLAVGLKSISVKGFIEPPVESKRRGGDEDNLSPVREAFEELDYYGAYPDQKRTKNGLTARQSAAVKLKLVSSSEDLYQVYCT